MTTPPSGDAPQGQYPPPPYGQPYGPQPTQQYGPHPPPQYGQYGQYGEQPPYQPYAAGPGGAPPLRGRVPLRLALIFGVIGVALLVVGGVIGFSQGLSKVNSFQRVSVADGIRSVHLNAGNYVAYYEAPNFNTNRNIVPVLILQILDPSSGHLLSGSLYGGRTDHKVKILTYDYGGHHGAALYQFRAPHSGTYKVRVLRPPTSEAAPNADIAIGPSIATGLAVGGVLAVVGGIALFLAIVLLVVGLVQRHNSKKRRAAAGQQYGAPPQYGYPQA